jgi:hypothetical protein
MAKITKAYIKQNEPKAKKIENTSFRYADLGNCYSYVEFGADVNGKPYRKQLKLEEFFEWIGGNILKQIEHGHKEKR